MTLNDILAWLSDDYRQKLETKRQQRMNYLLEKHLGVSDPSLRNKDGILKRQGIGGFYTDSLPYTLEDRLRSRSPEFMKELNKPPGRSDYDIESDWRDPLTYIPKGKYL